MFSFTRAQRSFSNHLREPRFGHEKASSVHLRAIKSVENIHKHLNLLHIKNS